MNERAFNQPLKKVGDDFAAMGARVDGLGGKLIPKDASNRWHNLIASNVAVALGSRLKGNRCEIYINGMRVKLKNNLSCYPDVVVVSGEATFADQNADVLLNPTVVFEVVSSVTNPLNKSAKLESYLAMESIKECVMIKADEMRVEHYSKQNAKQWTYRIYNEKEDVITLDSVTCKISIAEVYSQIGVQPAAFSSRAVN
ncbi:MAG: Uma2 family endonuclease [Pyrinomonadaceae bacterium]